MTPLRDISALEPGDVLHHVDLGFSVVDQIDEAGAGVSLAWPAGGPGRPGRVTAALLIDEYRLCTPGGFLARSVTATQGLSDLVELDAPAALRLLLEDVNGPLRVVDIQRWLYRLNLLTPEDFPGWWRAVQPAFHAGDLQWDGEQASLRARPQPVSDQPTAREFLTGSPAARFGMLQAIPVSARPALLESALQSGDTDAVVLLLRGRPPLNAALREALSARVRGGESRVATALLNQDDPKILDIFIALASLDEGQPILRDALERLPPRRRDAVLETLCTHAEQRHSRGGADLYLRALRLEPPAAPSADATQVTITPEEDEDIPPFPMLDTTVKVSVEPGSAMLTQSGPLPPHRILPVSLALARALAARHALGEAGGILGARVKAGGAVELGPPEDSTPRRDVRDAMRVIADLAVGRRPPGGRVEDEHILAHLALLVPGAPLDWVAVLTRALSPVEELRPGNGLDLWAQLERAAAQDRLRSQAPARPFARLDLAHDTHIGLLKSRLGQVNQDAVFWYTDGRATLVIVADGISISTAGTGDLASTILVRVVVAMWEQHRERLPDASPSEIRGFLQAALSSANQAICNASLRLAGGDLSQQIPMGTTVIVGVARGAELHLAQLGDSRAFLLSPCGTALVTGDQNLRAEWLLSWQQGRPMDLNNEGHALTGYCGHFNERGIPELVQPVFRTVPLLPGESLVLCSDGLTDYAADSVAEIAVLLEEAARKEDLGEAARSLTAAANARGGGDNITVALVRLQRD